MKSLFDLDENIVAFLAYLFGAFSGVAVLILERENKFVRFHALQSTLWFLFLWVVTAIVGFITNILTSIWVVGTLFGIVLSPVSLILGLIGFASWLFLMYKAFQGTTFKIPLLGEVVSAQIFK